MGGQSQSKEAVWEGSPAMFLSHISNCRDSFLAPSPPSPIHYILMLNLSRGEDTEAKEIICISRELPTPELGGGMLCCFHVQAKSPVTLRDCNMRF